MSTRREFSLADVRADGWFARVGEDNPGFDDLCSVVGERPLAFSLIAGVQIASITIDRARPSESIVEFVTGDAKPTHRLPLAEFRRRVALALLSGDESRPELPEETPSLEDLQAFLGARIILLAPLFGVSLESLIVEAGRSSVLVSVGTSRMTLPLDSLVTTFDARIRREIEAFETPASSQSLDLGHIDEAERRSRRDDWDGTIELLGSWPGPLSTLIRTADGARLAPDTRARLARALGLLGTAYAQKQRFDLAEEVMRLGIQWGQDGPAAGDLFRRLGEASMSRDRPGEAIGFLRRSLALGAPSREVLPTLSRAFAARGKWVAAMATLEEAVAAGADEQGVAAHRAVVREKLGAAYANFREHVPTTRSAAPTRRPPPRKD